jgi:hypothetical protein
MVFKSDIKEYWGRKGEKLIENITIVSEEIEAKGYVVKEPIIMEVNKTKYAYDIHLIVENRLVANILYAKCNDIWVDGIKFYRGNVAQKPQIVRPANDIDYLFEFQYISYDLFD